jgi:hypothetical protein
VTPIDAALVFALLFLPLNWLVLQHFDRLEDAGYLRGCGVVICSENVIEARGAPLGVYRDAPVSGWVMFKGMQYRFDRVTEGERNRAG